MRESVPEEVARKLATAAPSRLTFYDRQALRAEIDCARRSKLAEADRQEAERLLAMFADERPLA